MRIARWLIFTPRLVGRILASNPQHANGSRSSAKNPFYLRWPSLKASASVWPACKQWNGIARSRKDMSCRPGLSCPQPSLSCQLSCCAARRPRKPQQAPPPRFPPSRSKRRSRRQGRGRQSAQRRLSGHRQPLARDRQPPNRRPRERQRQVHPWRGLPRWRESPAVVTAAVQQASPAARIPGLDVASRAAA